MPSHVMLRIAYPETEHACSGWLVWSALEYVMSVGILDSSFLQRVSTQSFVILRNLTIHSAGFQCFIPGFDENCATNCTAFEISG